MLHWKGLALTGFAAAALAAQDFTDRDATVRGGGDGNSGKCTVEVEVDIVAEVAIRATRGRLTTFGGSPATWRRFECNAPLPARVNDFRFRGIDGRGRQTLVQDPRSNRGVAVIRLEDQKGGREGYTFDIEWSGGSGLGYGDRFPGEEGGYRGGRGRGNRQDLDGRARRDCEDAVREEARRRYSASNINIRGLRQDPSRRDYLVGEFDGGQSFFGAARYSFSCSVDDDGRIRGVNIERSGGGQNRPDNNGGGFFGNGNSPEQACETAVREQASRQFNVRDTRFEGTRPDANPGRRDYLVGSFRDRGNRYFFSCRMSGTNVRSVTVDPDR